MSWIAAFAALAAAAQSPSPRFEAHEIGFRHEASKTVRKHLIETMGAGVALLDYDGDGRLDVFFPNGAAIVEGALDKSDPRYWNRLYRNLGGLRFEDATEAAGLSGFGYGMGAVAGDYDGDGDPDLFVTGYPRNRLYRNDGGRFTDATKEAGVEGDGWSTGAALLDYDGDGRLDLFVARYLNWNFRTSKPCGERGESYCHPREYGAVAHRLYRNRGGGRFEEASQAVGLPAHPGKGLGVVAADLNADGLLDVFVANDSAPQQLFLNVGGERFEEAAVRMGVAYEADGRTYSGMGAAVADYDNDGAADLFVNALALEGYSLYRAAAGDFEPTAQISGLLAASERHSGWGASFADFDRDGFRDLFVAQGHVMDDIEASDPTLSYREPMLLLRNVHGRWFDVSASAGPAFRRPLAARGAAVGDLDDDGDPDIVVNVNDGPALLLENTTATDAGWIGFDVGEIGARVRLRLQDGRELTAQVVSGGSYLSSSDPRVLFGLGSGQPAEAEVVFPDGSVQRIEKPKEGRYHRARR